MNYSFSCFLFSCIYCKYLSNLSFVMYFFSPVDLFIISTFCVFFVSIFGFSNFTSLCSVPCLLSFSCALNVTLGRRFLLPSKTRSRLCLTLVSACSSNVTCGSLGCSGFAIGWLFFSICASSSLFWGCDNYWDYIY